MTNVADDNTPYKRLVEQNIALLDNPPAGTQLLVIDEDDHLLKLINSAGDVTEIGTGGGGGTVFLGEVPVTGAAQLDITSLIDDTYDEYIIRFNGKPATDGGNIAMLLSTDNGGTWISANYKYAMYVTYASGYAANVTSASDSSIAITGECGNGSDEGFSIEIRCCNFRDTVQRRMVQFHLTTIRAGNMINGQGSGSNSSTSAINAVRLKSTVGNITATARIYGVAKS